MTTIDPNAPPASRYDGTVLTRDITAILATRLIREVAWPDSEPDLRQANRLIHDYRGTAYLPSDVRITGTAATPGGFRCCRIIGPTDVVLAWFAKVNARLIVGDVHTLRGFGLREGDVVWSVP